MTIRRKFALAAAALLLAGSFGLASTHRTATAAPDVDVTVFYRPLAAYGQWIPLPTYGWAWVPSDMDYGWRPYSVGRWAWVNPYGWTWVSDEPWGWATYHYGRWTYVDDYGWAWIPGTQWAPAWVEFRYGDPWIGWAPLPPSTSWRFDADFDIGGLNVDVSVGAYAWSFVQSRYFAEPNLRTRLMVSSYNPYFLRRTRHASNYATVDGGISNRSIDVGIVEKARGAPVPRHRFEESASASGEGPATRVDGDKVVLFRPRITQKVSDKLPEPRVRGDLDPRRGGDLETWAARRRAALQAHLDAQKKALEEEQDDAPVPTGQPKAPKSPDDVDPANRREAARKAFEEERKRLEGLFERERQRREREQKQRSGPGGDDRRDGDKPKKDKDDGPKPPKNDKKGKNEDDENKGE